MTQPVPARPEGISAALWASLSPAGRQRVYDACNPVLTPWPPPKRPFGEITDRNGNVIG